MAGGVAEFEVLGPWSLEASRRSWEGFTPAALAGEPSGPRLHTVFVPRVTGITPRQG